MAKTKIEWATDSWNPVTGCTPVSTGCQNCYARRMAKRLGGRYGYPQDDPFKVTLHPDRLDQPLHWRKPKMIFVCSMSDLFHHQVNFGFLAEAWNIMRKCPQHIFILLTKRPSRMREFMELRPPYSKSWPFPKHIWLGVSVENQETADKRIGELLKVPAAVIVVSYEPALGSLVLPPEFLERGKRAWLICGGETGPGARPMNPDWVRQIRDQCVNAGVPFFFKQTGPWIPDRLADPTESYVRDVDGLRMSLTNRKRHPIAAKLGKRLLDGQVWDQVPEMPDATR